MNKEYPNIPKEPTVDDTTINQLKTLMKQKFVLVLDDYLQASEEYIKKIEDAIAQNDYKQIADMTHTLKSSSGQVGAMKLRALSKQLETKAKNSDLTNVKDIFGGIQVEFKEVQEQLYEYIKTAAIRKKCLVIDDSRLHRAVASEIVMELGFDSAETESAMDSLSFVESGYVDFVLVDWHMPTMNGVEFIRSLRNDNNNIPIFLYSNIEDEDGTAEAMAAGASGFVPKPLTKEKMEIEFKKFGLL